MTKLTKLTFNEAVDFLTIEKKKEKNWNDMKRKIMTKKMVGLVDGIINNSQTEIIKESNDLEEIIEEVKKVIE